MPPGGTGEYVSRTLSDNVYQRLRTDIVWGRLAPGVPLRSDELRKTYEIGISPLREALTRLASERLVVGVEQRGFRVAPLDFRDVRDTCKTRILIESQALRRSIELGDVAWETEIVAAAHALARTPPASSELREWSEYHRRLHFALLAACGSDWLLRMATLLYDHAERHRIIGNNNTPLGARADRSDEHADLGRAALSRDADVAVAILTRHYSLTADYVAQAVGIGPAAGPLPINLQTGQTRLSPARRVSR